MNKEEIIPGMLVTYWSFRTITGELLDPTDTEIESEPWEIGGGEIICRVKGVKGGVSIKHLTKR